MNPYAKGFCPCCSTPILLKDELRRYVTKKPNFREIFITLENGSKVCSAICSDCIKNVNLNDLIEAITMDGSEALNNRKLLEDIKNWGNPVGHEERKL